jgi:hypothetical protein
MADWGDWETAGAPRHMDAGLHMPFYMDGLSPQERRDPARLSETGWKDPRPACAESSESQSYSNMPRAWRWPLIITPCGQLIRPPQKKLEERTNKRRFLTKSPSCTRRPGQDHSSPPSQYSRETAAARPKAANPFLTSYDTVLTILSGSNSQNVCAQKTRKRL